MTDRNVKEPQTIRINLGRPVEVPLGDGMPTPTPGKCTKALCINSSLFMY